MDNDIAIFDKKRGKWISRIRPDKTWATLGWYDTEQQARDAYQDELKACEEWGKYSKAK